MREEDWDWDEAEAEADLTDSSQESRSDEEAIGAPGSDVDAFGSCDLSCALLSSWWESLSGAGAALATLWCTLLLFFTHSESFVTVSSCFWRNKA